MRRVVPLFLLGVLGALTAGGAALAVTHAPTVITYSAPRVGNPQAVESLRLLVHNVTQENSYVVSSPTERFVFQSPDRVEYVPLKANSTKRHAIVIGDTVYEVMGTTSRGVPQWGEGPATQDVLQNYGPNAAQFLLEELFSATSVVQQGNTFIVSQVEPNGFANYFGDQNGQLLYQLFVHQKDGLISSVAISFSGLAPNRVIRDVAQYLDYNHAPPIVPPPASEIIKLVPCQGGGSEYSTDGYICGLLSS